MANPITPISQQYRLQWPLNASQVESIDQMFETLFRSLRNGSINVAVTQIAGIVDVAHGGTGISTYAKGDMLYADAVNHLAKLTFVPTATRYLANTGGGATIPAWDTVNLSNGVNSRLPFANLVQATGATKLIGRGAASGAGDFQEITLGADLTMAGTVLDLVQASGASKLLGRGSAAGAGEFQEITLGSGLTMTGTVLSATGATSTQWSVLTNGSGTWPELIFTSFGDVIMTQQ